MLPNFDYYLSVVLLLPRRTCFIFQVVRLLANISFLIVIAKEK